MPDTRETVSLENLKDVLSKAESATAALPESSSDAPVQGEGQAPVYEQKLDAYGRAYATGKRKDAIARVWLKPGKGHILINKKTHTDYFARAILQLLMRQPLVLASRSTQYDIVATVSGGGLSGQAGALRHGIAKALAHYEPELRALLKKAGFLTRDSRVVERKNMVVVKPVAASSSQNADESWFVRVVRLCFRHGL